MSDLASLAAMMGLMFPNGQPGGLPANSAFWLPQQETVVPTGNMPPAREVLPEVTGPLPFYPAERYVKYRHAPETSLTAEDLSQIAAARRQAEKAQILSPELAEQLLPMAMVEGEGLKLGILENQGGYYASRQLMKKLSDMELEEGKDYLTSYIKGEKHVVPLKGSPALAAVILSEKAALKHVGGDVEKAVTAYNIGTPTHWEKVKEARRLLSHPMNEKFYQHFDREYKR